MKKLINGDYRVIEPEKFFIPYSVNSGEYTRYSN